MQIAHRILTVQVAVTSATVLMAHATQLLVSVPVMLASKVQAATNVTSYSSNITLL